MGNSSCKSHAVGTPYKLYYFPTRGRAECLRYILHYTNTPYQEVPISGEEWYSTYKKKMPMGSMPVLELSDGRQLCQSLAIGRYLATVHGLVSKDPFENAWGDQLVGAIEDVYPIYYTNYALAIMTGDEHKKPDALKALKEQGFTPLFEKLERFLGDKEYFCGKQLHWSDLVIAELVQRVETMIDKGVVSKFPRLKAHSGRIHQLPSLKRYIEKRPPAVL